MFKRFVSIFVFVSLLASTTSVRANDTTEKTVQLDEVVLQPTAPKNDENVGKAVSPMRKDQRAPFTGVLLSPEAIATIMSSLNSIDEEIKINVDKAVSDSEARCKFTTEELKAQMDAKEKILNAKLTGVTKSLDLTNKELKKAVEDRPNVVLWTGFGFVGGILVTTAIVWGVVQVTN